MECFSEKDKGQDGGVGYTNIWLVSTTGLRPVPMWSCTYIPKPTVQHMIH